METRLRSHPAFGNGPVEGDIRVSVKRPSAAILRLRYVLRGRVEEIVLPAPAAPLRADNLWKTTCFEAFLARDGEAGYVELNFSPSSHWAAYAFAGYRDGMAQAELPAPPIIEVERSSDRLALTATVPLPLPHGRFRLGLAAVVEERGGGMAYFAARHGGDRPDFHRRDCFTLELPPPERP